MKYKVRLEGFVSSRQDFFAEVVIEATSVEDALFKARQCESDGLIHWEEDNESLETYYTDREVTKVLVNDEKVALPIYRNAVGAEESE